MAPLTTDIWIVTFPRDYEWLGYCLRSIKKFTTGYRQLHIAKPPQAPLPEVPKGLEICWHDDAPGFRDGYIGQQITKMRAYQHTDAECIAFIDSDHVCVEPTDMGYYFDGGCPQLWCRSFEQISQIPEDPKAGVTRVACRWQPIVEKCLRFPCPWFTLEFLPLIFYRGTLARLCEYIEDVQARSLEDYARHQPWREFSEFITMGNWVMRREQDRYSVRRTISGPETFRFHGHSPYVPIPAKTRAFLEDVLK